MTSTSSYHKATLVSALPREFDGVSTSMILEMIDADAHHRLRVMEDAIKEPTKTRTLRLIEAQLDRAISELESRYARMQRHKGDPYAPSWPNMDRFEALKKIAQEIKFQLPLVQYLDGYPWVVLNKRGDRWSGRCPFPHHADHTASFVVFPDHTGGHFHCFGCGSGGDLFTAIGLLEGIPRFREQVDFAARMLGNEVPA